MSSEKFVTAYRFDDWLPKVGEVVHCFKSIEALEGFAKLQGRDFKSVRFWEIKGNVIRDEGGEDGWVIKVQQFKEVPKQLY